ncbi:MAG: hypothetical protein M1273_08240 [Deltaproteobacteria bacterium]|jgi:hypothetical protein|nr:hypothetical protein [Deltaproteobacteria bacterium]
MKLELRNKITLEKDGHKVIFEMYKESDYLGTKGDNKTDLFNFISEEIPGKKSRTVVLIYRDEIAKRMRFYKKQLNYTEA